MPNLLKDLNNILAAITMVLLLIFSVFLFTIKGQEKFRTKILSYFLLINAAFIAGFLSINYLHPVSIINTTFFYLLHSSGLLFGPALFYYTKITIYRESKFRKAGLFHLIPFSIAIVYIFTRFWVFKAANQIWFTAIESSVYDIIANLQVLIYMCFAIIEVRKYRAKIREFYSSVTGLNYSWLVIVLYGFLFMWLIDFTNFLLRKFVVLDIYIGLSIITASILINFIFAVLLFYKSLTHPELFKAEIKEEKQKYEKSKLAKEDADKYLCKLQDYMVSQKPYLNPDININELSESVDIPARFLSQIINDSLKQNFFDFINHYRIEESKKYLTDSKYKKLNVLEILYEAGFNSKSTFNKVFKEHTGLTPTAYRQKFSS